MTHLDLQKTLALEQLSPDVFQSTQEFYKPMLARGLFGGVLVAQALYSSILTTAEDYIPHSLHSYFLAPAVSTYPIVYKVDRTRDGNSFLSREVKAYQNDRLVFLQNISFCLADLNSSRNNPPQLSLSKPVPNVAFDEYVDPEIALESAIKSGRALGIRQAPVPQAKKLFLDELKKGPTEERVSLDFYESSIDQRHKDHDKRPHEITTNVFIKVHHDITIDKRFHYVAFAYYSDSYILITTMKNHRRPLYSAALSVSLDHSIYFHKEFNVNQWMLFHVEHPRAKDSRMLAYGELYDKEEIVATVIQEGFVVIDDELVKPKL